MKVAYPFQQEAIDLGVQRNLFLGDECGLGKKFTCLSVAKEIQRSLRLPTLVVTIKQDVHQWIRELKLEHPEAKVTVGTVEPLFVDEAPDWWLVMHYEALVRHERPLSKVKFGTVILDEGHYIKSPSAQRTMAAKKLRAQRKVVATGTPMDKSPIDLWAPLSFLYPEKWGRMQEGYRTFKEKHAKFFVDNAGHERILPGAKDPVALAAILSPFYIARTKKEVAPQLPPNIQKEQTIVLTGAQATLYRRIANSTDIEVPLTEGMEHEETETLYIPNAMVQMLREQQAALDPDLLFSSATSAKLEWVREWRHGNPLEPTIFFTNYRSMAQKLAKELNAHLVMGGVKLPDEWTKPSIVATIGAGSTALDLGHLSTAIFLDTHWSHLKMEQALNRIHRLSNKHTVHTIFLTAQDTVDEMFLASFREKWDQFQLIRTWSEHFRRKRVPTR